jgi:hypothetical protein
VVEDFSEDEDSEVVLFDFLVEVELELPDE